MSDFMGKIYFVGKAFSGKMLKFQRGGHGGNSNEN